MIIVSEQNFYPIMQEVAQYEKLSVKERLPKYLLVLSHIILPLGKQYLLTFILIWNEILNGIAELSRYGDRHFTTLGGLVSTTWIFKKMEHRRS